MATEGFSGIDFWAVDIRNPFYGMYAFSVILAVPFIFMYKAKVAFRKEWLIWAKERGYEENAEKI